MINERLFYLIIVFALIVHWQSLYCKYAVKGVMKKCISYLCDFKRLNIEHKKIKSKHIFLENILLKKIHISVWMYNNIFKLKICKT